MRLTAVGAGAVLVLLSVAALGLLATSETGEKRPQPSSPGRPYVEYTPAPKWWASHSLAVEVASGLPPAWRLAHTPTPTSTPTPVPTETPLPTWTPVPYVPPEPTQAVQRAPTGDWRDLVCSYGWSCSEALNVIAHESGGNPNATNPSSGACGLFQLYPCPSGGYDVATNVALAWAKYVAGGYSFYAHWYAWW